MSNKVLNSKDQRELLQPLDRDGYSSEEFEKVYGQDACPYIGTDRDRLFKKKSKFFSMSEEQYNTIFKKNEN